MKTRNVIKTVFTVLLCTVMLIGLISAALPLQTDAESEPEEHLYGDLDGDGTVNDRDAIYLLFYTFFPADYPVYDNVDFDMDGKITDFDAIYLLFYTFFPEQYPLSVEVSLNSLTAKRLAAIPIANANMTKQQLRQLCIDFFETQLFFQWVSDTDINDWNSTYYQGEKKIDKGDIYGGIPYQSKGYGNIYRWLEYTDPLTGTFNFEKALFENGGYGEGAAVTDIKTDTNGNPVYKKYRSLMTLFNQCSSSSFWAWGRVVNSANFETTAEMNIYDGFIPVGCYSYPNAETIDKFGEVTTGNPDKFDTADVISYWNAENGAAAMYECYAKMKPADCLVSGSHAMMVKSVETVRKNDGTIDEKRSKVNIIEQVESWSYTDILYDKPYHVQGRARYFTFKELKESSYIPFTFAEFLDTDDPQDKEHLDYYYSYVGNIPRFKEEYSAFSFTPEQIKEMTGIGIEKAKVFNTLGRSTGEITVEELKNMTVASNYPISDVFVTAAGKDGKEAVRNIYRSLSARKRQVAMSEHKSTWEEDESGNLVPVSEGLEKAVGGEVIIVLQLSTGEKLTVFSGTITE